MYVGAVMESYRIWDALDMYVRKVRSKYIRTISRDSKFEISTQTELLILQRPIEI